MEKERIKNHIRLSLIVVFLGWLLSSYVFGSFTHDGISPTQKIRVLTTIGLFVAAANFGYSEIFYKNKNK